MSLRPDTMHPELPQGVSVVVPVYHSEASLRPLLDRLLPVLEALPGGHEVVLVEDGSKDASWRVLRELCKSHAACRGLRLSRNFGQHNALLCGVLAARYAVTVTMDDDLQNPPEEVPKLLAALTEDADVVYGKPAQEQHGLWRDLASWFTKLALKSAMGAETARHVSAFRAFRTPLRGAFAHYRGPSVSIDVLLTWASNRFTAITVEHAPRELGQSNYTFRRLLRHAFNMMTGFSTMPLHVASWIGFAFMGLGLALLIYVVTGYFLFGRTVPGFAFTASAVSLFSGVQLFALGMIGEYLARIHWRTMDRPTFVVAEQLGGAET